MFKHAIMNVFWCFLLKTGDSNPRKLESRTKNYGGDLKKKKTVAIKKKDTKRNNDKNMYVVCVCVAKLTSPRGETGRCLMRK